MFSTILLKSNFLLKIASFFSPSWGVFASRDAVPQLSLLEKTGPIPINSEKTDVAVTITNRKANVFQVARVSGDLKGKYTIPTNELASKKLEMSYACVKLIRRLRPDLSTNLPEISLYSRRAHLLDHTKGIPGDRLNLKAEKDLQLFFAFLSEFSDILVPGPEIKGIFQEFDVRQRLIHLAEQDESHRQLKDILKRPQIIHGDLNNGNIFVSRMPFPKIVINDFEHAKIGPAVLNWYDFLLRNLVIYGSSYPIETDLALQRCQRLPGNKNSNPVLNKMTATFLDICQVPLELHPQLTILNMRYLFQDPVVDDSNTLINAIKSMKYGL